MTWAACSDPAIGYDLSHWQGIPSARVWAKARALGVQWAISKTWHGASLVSTAQPQLDAARAAGLEVLGRYSWLLPDSPIDAQVKAWCSIPRERDDELPLTIDWEHPDTQLRGRPLVSRLEYAIHAYADATGHLPFVYTGEWYWRGYCLDVDSEIVSRCQLHLAAYPRKTASGVRYREAVAEVCGGVMPSVPIVWRSRDIEPISWQLDGDGGVYLPKDDDEGEMIVVPGPGDVDLNVAAWQRLLFQLRYARSVCQPGRAALEPGLQLSDGRPPNDPYYVDRLEAARDEGVSDSQRTTPVPETEPEGGSR